MGEPLGTGAVVSTDMTAELQAAPNPTHQIQNALARAICLLEEAQDAAAAQPSLIDVLDRAMDELVEAGRLISRG